MNTHDLIAALVELDDDARQSVLDLVASLTGCRARRAAMIQRYPTKDTNHHDRSDNRHP